MRAVVLLNEAAGRGSTRSKQELVRQIASRSQIPVRTAPTGEAMEGLARHMALDGNDRVIAAGGDGTVHRVLNGIAGTSAALGIIPCGSGNDLAINLGIPRELEAATEHAFTARWRNIDLCRVNGRYFGCIASFGLDSHANRVANQHRGPFRGTALYIWSLLVALTQFKPPNVIVQHDEGEYRGPILLLVAANAASYGGGLRIAPSAQVADGLIDFVAVHAMPRLALLWHLPKVFSGSHVALEQVSYKLSRKLQIDADRPLDIFADGEYVGQTPATVEILPGALRVIAPAA
jgi:diacylglycerol kinase (ATP)